MWYNISMKVKITKLNNLQIWQDGTVVVSAVHFKLDDEDYFLHYSCEDYEHCLTLYKGRNKGHLTHITSCRGDLKDMIKFVKKPRCLKYIDTDYFIEKLKEYHLL